MSIGICRVEKYQSAHDIAGIQIHDRRERDHSNSNPDIDFSRSQDNYILCDNTAGKSFNEYIDEQIKVRYTGKKAIRKDAVRMFQVLCTSDKEFFDRSEDNGRAYFEACLRWACERWGTQNIVSAVVHLDESVPHLHINIVPLTEDGRLSAKACVGDGSKALQQLQDDFFQECSEDFNLERGSRTKLDEGEKPRKHQKMGDYKRNRATIQAQEATIRGQVEILHAEPENAIQGIPVPSMAKPFIGKENKDKVLYSSDDVNAIQELAKAMAITAANTERRQAELAAEKVKTESEAAEILTAANAEAARVMSEAERIMSESRKSAKRQEEYEREKEHEFQKREQNFEDAVSSKIEEYTRENQNLQMKYYSLKVSYNAATKEVDELNKKLAEKEKKIEDLRKVNDELKDELREIMHKDSEKQHVEYPTTKGDHFRNILEGKNIQYIPSVLVNKADLPEIEQIVQECLAIKHVEDFSEMCREIAEKIEHEHRIGGSEYSR